MSKPRKDLTGTFYGMYEVLNYICHDEKSGKSYWSCLCHGCNNKFKVYGSNLTEGKSHGCQRCVANKRVYEDTLNRIESGEQAGTEDIKRYHDLRHIIDINLHLFREPLRALHNAYVTKTRGNAECAFKDIIKVIKSLEKKRAIANEKLQ